jgi:hypothetical protein
VARRQCVNRRNLLKKKGVPMAVKVSKI